MRVGESRLNALNPVCNHVLVVCLVFRHPHARPVGRLVVEKRVQDCEGWLCESILAVCVHLRVVQLWLLSHRFVQFDCRWRMVLQGCRHVTARSLKGVLPAACVIVCFAILDVVNGQVVRGQLDTQGCGKVDHASRLYYVRFMPRCVRSCGCWLKPRPALMLGLIRW